MTVEECKERLERLHNEKRRYNAMYAQSAIAKVNESIEPLEALLKHLEERERLLLEARTIIVGLQENTLTELDWTAKLDGVLSGDSSPTTPAQSQATQEAG